MNAGTSSARPALAPLAQPLEQRLVVGRGAVGAAADASSRRPVWQRLAALAAHARAALPLAGRAWTASSSVSGSSGVEEPRRLAGAATARLAGQRPRQREVASGAGHADVEQPALLLDRGRRLGVGDRERAVLEAAEEHRVPLEALGGVERRERDAVGDRGVLLGGAAVEVVDELVERAAADSSSRPGRPAPARTPSGRGSGRGPWAARRSSPCRRAWRARSRAAPSPSPERAAPRIRVTASRTSGAVEEPGRAADDVGDAARRPAPPRRSRTGR